VGSVPSEGQPYPRSMLLPHGDLAAGTSGQNHASGLGQATEEGRDDRSKLFARLASRVLMD
jgi:hypothetical protein